MSPSTSRIDPFTDPICTAIWQHFIQLINERELDSARHLLNEQIKTVSQSHQRQFIDYCRAILFIEKNEWDRCEQLTIALLRQTLHPHLQMRVYNERAIANEHLGRLFEAMRLYTTAIEIAERYSETLFWAKVVKNRGICAIRLFESGQIVETAFLAIQNQFEQAIRIFQESNERLEEGQCWNELGVFHKASKHWDDAVACYKQELTIVREQSDQHGIASCLNNLGEAYLAQARYNQAESLLRQAAEIFARLKDPFEQADALVNLGKALAQQQKQEEAADVFTQAITCVESVRRGIGVETARSDFFATQTHIYGAKIAHCLAQGDVHSAFDFTERARARGLLDMMAGADVRVPTAVPASLQQREQTLRYQLAQADEQAAFAAIEQELAQLYRELEIMAPEYASLRQMAPLSVVQILQMLPPQTAFVSYFALDNRYMAFVVSPSRGVQTYELPIASADLAAASFDVQGRPRSLLPAQGEHLPRPWLLERLYMALVHPLMPACSDCERLVLIPHGPLHHLPLHAAYCQEEGRYLCEMFDIVYAPSATIQSSYLGHIARDEQRSGVLAVQCGSANLMHPRHEVQAIAALSHGLALAGAEATLEQLLEASKQYRYLHLAGHAWFRRETPMLSGIDLADQRLTAWDMLQLPHLGFALVSVNGCESGLSYVQAGDEQLGVLRALLYAVAPSVLLTLWPIEDLSARIFAQLFYSTLWAETAPAQSLSRTLRKTIQTFRQLSHDEIDELLRSDGYSAAQIQEMLARLPHRMPGAAVDALPVRPFEHPYFWAGYLLVGEAWEPKFYGPRDAR